MSRNEFLYDDIGREYERLNQYLIELIKLEKTGDKNKVDEFIKNRQNHPYIVKLNEYKKMESEFLAGLKNEDKKTSGSKLEDLKIKENIAAKKRDFYKPISDYEYDFKYEYLVNDKMAEELNHIIERYEEIELEIAQTKDALTKVSEADEKKAEEEIKAYTIEIENNVKAQSEDIKQKKDQKRISQKAYKNELKVIKRKAKDLVENKKFDSDRYRLSERLKSLEYSLKNDTKNLEKVLNDNISAIRRTVPIEKEETSSLKYFLAIPIPGLGQLFNKQYYKAIFYFVLGLLSFFVTIPYALGYGNYQGKGLIGLATLAEGAARTHKSLIYMIEGIIAIALIIFSLLVFYLAFRDAYKVHKKEILGIRSNSWFESKNFLQRGGFPIIVNVPALILIVFIIMVPIATAILLSFTGMDPKHQSKFPWVGLENYLTIATGKGLTGSIFWKILLWTVIWTIGASSLAIFIGFVLAIIANNERIKGKGLFRSIFILPWAVPAFITIMFFSIMVSQNGLITELIKSVTGLNIVIKNSTVATRVFLILLQGWLGSSYIFLLTTGVLQAIPHDLYEAAEIDGATGLQQTTKITIPLVLFQIAPLLVTQYTFNFNNFSIIYLFNEGGPFNPSEYGNLAGSSDILISYIYKLTMENQYQAMGAVITILISLGLMVIAFLGFRNSAALKED